MTSKGNINRRNKYLVFAYCAISRPLFNELIDEVPFAQTTWKKDLRVTKSAFDAVKARIIEQSPCFELILESLKDVAKIGNGCPDPPCPDIGWLSNVAEAARNAPGPLPAEVRKGKKKGSKS